MRNLNINKKVRNATKISCDGIDFKSKLELYCHTKLKENGIQATYEGTTFILVPAFSYNDEKVRKMTYTPDFVGDSFIIECKGMMNDAFPLKWKLFKYLLHKKKKRYILYLPRNRKDVDALIINLKNDK
jgi:hypothetical protein